MGLTTIGIKTTCSGSGRARADPNEQQHINVFPWGSSVVSLDARETQQPASFARDRHIRSGPLSLLSDERHSDAADWLIRTVHTLVLLRQGSENASSKRFTKYRRAVGMDVQTHRARCDGSGDRMESHLSYAIELERLTRDLNGRSRGRAISLSFMVRRPARASPSSNSHVLDLQRLFCCRVRNQRM